MKFSPVNNSTPRDYIHFPDRFEQSFLEECTIHIKNKINPRNDTGTPNPNGVPKTERQVWDILYEENNYLIQKLLNIINYCALEANSYFQFDLENIIDFYYMEYTYNNTIPLDWHLDLHNGHPYNQRKLSFSLLVNNIKEY